MKSSSILTLALSALEDDKASTPGPWEAHKLPRWADGTDTAYVNVEFGVPLVVNEDGAMLRPDARLIANARSREPQLARWIAGVLGASPLPWLRLTINAGFGIDIANSKGRPVQCVTPGEARALAAALLRAADEAEAVKP